MMQTVSLLEQRHKNVRSRTCPTHKRHLETRAEALRVTVALCEALQTSEVQANERKVDRANDANAAF